MGRIAGRRFGHPAAPLLVSVRSGARASIPGMMNTVLNLGLNDAIVEALAASSEDGRFSNSLAATEDDPSADKHSPQGQPRSASIDG